MLWLQAVTIALAVGVAAGWGAGQLPIAPLAQSVAGFLVAMLVGNGWTLVWWTRRYCSGSYFGVGLDNLAYVAILGVGAAVLHAGLGSLGTVWIPALETHRAVVLGCAGGLVGTLSSAWAVTATRRTRD